MCHAGSGGGPGSEPVCVAVAPGVIPHDGLCAIQGLEGALAQTPFVLRLPPESDGFSDEEQEGGGAAQVK